MKFELDEERMLLEFRKSTWSNGKTWLNQADKSRLTNLSQSYVSRLESGERKFQDLRMWQYLQVCEGMGFAPFEFLKRV